MHRSGTRARTIKTLKGELSFVRALRRCAHCGHSFAALDQELGVRPRLSLTPSLRRKVAWLGGRTSFAEAARDLKEMLDVSVSSSEFQRVCLEVGARFERLGRERDEQWRRAVSPQAPAPPPEVSPERLVLMADGTCVLTAAGEEHKTVWCGRAFALEAAGRTESSDRPFITDSRFAASGENFADFGPRLLALAYRCGFRRARKVAFIADGARCLWRWAKELPGHCVVLIQDFWHVCEHLSALAQELYGPQWQEPYARWQQQLLASQVDEVLEQLRGERARRRGERARRRGALRKRLQEEIGYLEAGRER
ncbi:hypothetical protein ACFL34_06195, partial [Candidatus Sumerlaeota bacterium]